MTGPITDTSLTDLMLAKTATIGPTLATKHCCGHLSFSVAQEDRYRIQELMFCYFSTFLIGKSLGTLGTLDARYSQVSICGIGR